MVRTSEVVWNTSTPRETYLSRLEAMSLSGSQDTEEGKVAMQMLEIRAEIVVKRKTFGGFYSQNYRREEKSLTGSLLPFRLSFSGAT